MALTGERGTARPCHVLFLCTGNSARSIMAESVLSRLGGSRFRAFSAGSRPAGRVHPLALEALAGAGYPIAALRSKSWDEFAGPDSPPIDIIITVCDNAAGETCPVWPGRPASGHWGLDDPAAFVGPPDAQRQVFEVTRRAIEARVARLVRLPPDVLAGAELRRHLDAIGAPSSPPRAATDRPVA